MSGNVRVCGFPKVPQCLQSRSVASMNGPAAERAMAAKRADYFACGTLVVWDVDLLSEDVIKSYKASDPEHPVIFHRGDMADAEPAVPGWGWQSVLCSIHSGSGRQHASVLLTGTGWTVSFKRTFTFPN